MGRIPRTNPKPQKTQGGKIPNQQEAKDEAKDLKSTGAIPCPCQDRSRCFHNRSRGTPLPTSFPSAQLRHKPAAGAALDMATHSADMEAKEAASETFQLKTVGLLSTNPLPKDTMKSPQTIERSPKLVHLMRWDVQV